MNPQTSDIIKSLFIKTFVFLLLITPTFAQPKPLEAPILLGNKKDIWQAAQQSTVSEEVYLLLSEQLKGLNHSLQNLKLPDTKARAIFAPNIEVLDLLDLPVETLDADLPAQLGIRPIQWPLRKTNVHRKSSKFDLWRPMLQRFARFETASFKIEKGRLFEQESTVYRGQVHFTARGQALDGMIVDLRGDIQVDWRYMENDAEGKKNAWLIERWQTRNLVGYEVKKTLFHEVLGDIVTDTNLLKRAQRSIHEEYVKNVMG